VAVPPLPPREAMLLPAMLLPAVGMEKEVLLSAVGTTLMEETPTITAFSAPTFPLSS